MGHKYKCVSTIHINSIDAGINAVISIVVLNTAYFIVATGWNATFDRLSCWFNKHWKLKIIFWNSHFQKRFVFENYSLELVGYSFVLVCIDCTRYGKSKRLLCSTVQLFSNLFTLFLVYNSRWKSFIPCWFGWKRRKWTSSQSQHHPSTKSMPRFCHPVQQYSSKDRCQVRLKR